MYRAEHEVLSPTGYTKAQSLHWGSGTPRKKGAQRLARARGPRTDFLKRWQYVRGVGEGERAETEDPCNFLANQSTNLVSSSFIKRPWIKKTKTALSQEKPRWGEMKTSTANLWLPHAYAHEFTHTHAHTKKSTHTLEKITSGVGDDGWTDGQKHC